MSLAMLFSWLVRWRMSLTNVRRTRVSHLTAPSKGSPGRCATAGCSRSTWAFLSPTMPAVMIQFTKLAVAGVHQVVGRELRELAALPAGEDRQDVLVERLVDMPVERRSRRTRHAAGRQDRDLVVDLVEDLPDRLPELVAAPRPRQRRDVAVGEHQHDRLVGLGIEEVRRQHLLAVHGAVGGHRHVEVPLQQPLEQPHAQVGVDLVDIGLLSSQFAMCCGMPLGADAKPSLPSYFGRWRR